MSYRSKLAKYSTPFQQAGKSLLQTEQNQSSLRLNPLLGESEGEVKGGLFKKEYKHFAKSKLDGSMIAVRERSWSKGKRGKLEHAIHEEKIFKPDSMAALMRGHESADRTENKLALKQRYQSSFKTLHVSNS